MSGYANYPFQGRAGAEQAADGSYQPFRLDRTGSIVSQDSHGKYYESVRLGNCFYLEVGPTTTGVAAGHIVGASGAAVCQIALLNPAGSGINVSITKVSIGIVSGTTPGGPVLHGYVGGATLAASVTTNAKPANRLFGSLAAPKTITIGVNASTGSAFTGGAAVVNGPAMNFQNFATATNVNTTAAVDEVNGSVVLQPGAGWVPLFTAAGSSVLSFLGVEWEEIPI